MSQHDVIEESNIEFFILKDILLRELQFQRNKRNKFKDADLDELSHHVIGFDQTGNLYVFNDYRDTKNASRLLSAKKKLGKTFHRMIRVNVNEIEKVLYHPTLDIKKPFGSNVKGVLYGADIELYRNQQLYPHSLVKLSSLWLLDGEISRRLNKWLTIKGIFSDLKEVKGRPIPLEKDRMESKHIGTFFNLFTWNFHTYRWELKQ